MCGIAGARSPDARSAATVRAMVAALAHRGPDGCAVQEMDHGCVALGHARLAIIDLSAAGAQPMRINGADDIWIVLNGEIYNYRALRQELEESGYVFRSHTDTEVLLAGYARWGAAMLERLDGIFAFAIWDDPRKRLWLVRDHIGVKPLYYTRDAKRFAFASEPKAVLAALDRAATPDRASVHDYLSFGYVPGERTAFAEIAKLPGGHMLWWENETVRVERWWDARASLGRSIGDGRTLGQETAQRVDAACASQLESDVPVGLLVSGGIDSSTVASSVARKAPGSAGFVIGFDAPEYDERPFARSLARSCGLRLEERLVGAEATSALLDRLATCHDEPFADSSSIPCLSLFELVRANSYKVVLGGDGGDELFSGYRRYDALERSEGASQAPWPRNLLGAQDVAQAARLTIRRARGRRPAWRAYYERIRRFSFAEQRAALTPEWRPEREDSLTWTFDSYWDSHVDTLKAAQLYDLSTYLPEDILAKVDRTSMHWGVEARVPLLSREMVEFAVAVPTREHRHGGERKRLLKRVLEGRVAPELISARKKGFGLPLRIAARATLDNWTAAADRSALVEDGVLTPGAIAGVGADLDKQWSLFALDRWWTRWVRGARA